MIFLWFSTAEQNVRCLTKTVFWQFFFCHDRPVSVNIPVIFIFHKEGGEQ